MDKSVINELTALMEEFSLFFESKSATSLILAGVPGTGKTTLALQILDRLTGIRESSIERLNREINELKKYNDTIVYLLSLSTIEKFRGQVAFLEIVDFINNIINSYDVGIAIAKPGVITENQIKNMATVQIRILNIFNKLCIYGNSPKTILYAIEPSKNYSFDLMPIV